MPGMKMIGVVGASGTGKTTLCEKSGFTFLRTSVSDVYKQISAETGVNVDPKIPMSLSMRIQVQRRILGHHKKFWLESFKEYEGKNITFVTDRTPICFMTYLLAEVSGYGEIDEADQIDLLDYLAECKEALSMFKGMFHLSMDEPMKAPEDGKVRATQNLAYHHHYQSISLGLLVNCYGGEWREYKANNIGDRVQDLRLFSGLLL